MALINKEHGQMVFDFNLRDKRGLPPLHYSVEKQDHDMFLALIKDKWVDPHGLDSEDFARARRSAVIFSAFHHILYMKEKMVMRRLFQENQIKANEAARLGVSRRSTSTARTRMLDHPFVAKSSASTNTNQLYDQNTGKKNLYQNLNIQSINQIKTDQMSYFKEVHQDAFETHEMLNFREMRRAQRKMLASRPIDTAKLSVFQKRHDVARSLAPQSILQHNKNQSPLNLRGRYPNDYNHKA